MLTSLLFGSLEKTIRKVVESKGMYIDSRKNRTFQDKDIPDSYKPKFLAEIKCSLASGKRCTAQVFEKILIYDGIKVSRRTVIRKLREWGLRWGRLAEKDIGRQKQTILNLREKYLEQLQILESSGYTKRIYIDESFRNENYSLKESWYSPVEGKEIHKPFGLGRRIALQGAITSDGWLGAEQDDIKDYLSLETRRVHSFKSIKYWTINRFDKNRGNVCGELFLKNFRENIIPNLETPSIIILDNAKYHISYNSSVINPTQNLKKDQLKKYLKDNDQSVEEKATKESLLKQAQEYFKKCKHKTIIETEAGEAGHKVLFLPPYHPELSPIEYCWAKLKKSAAEKPPYNIKTLSEKVLPEAFSVITPQFTNNTFQHVKDIEALYKEKFLQRHLSLGERIAEIEKLFETDSDSGLSEEYKLKNVMLNNEDLDRENQSLTPKENQIQDLIEISNESESDQFFLKKNKNQTLIRKILMLRLAMK